MAQTLITREMMGQVGTLNSLAQGNLGQIVSGNWFTRRVGPYDASTNAPGWSADVRAADFESQWNLIVPPYNQALVAGAMSCWIRFTSQGTGAPGPGVYSNFMQLYDAANTVILDVGVDKNGDIICADTNASSRFGAGFALHVWYFVLLEFTNISAVSVAYKLTIQPLNGLAQVIRDRSAGFNPGGAKQFTLAKFRNLSNSGAGNWDGRIGGCGLYSIAAFGDGRQPADLVPPVEKQNTWYLDTTSGNDGNDGISRTTAWKSDVKLAAELLNSGVLGSANPWKLSDGTFPVSPLNGAGFCGLHAAGQLTPNGDIVRIDTSGAPLSVTGQITIQGRAPGLLVTSGELDLADIQGFTVIPNSSWAKTAGQINIYETTNTENVVVLWEIPAGIPARDYWKSMIWLDHPVGVNFAAVAAQMDALPGSFWTDGTKMYVHPFGNTAAGLDGKTFVRSVRLGANANSLIDVQGNDCMLSNLKIGGTAIVDPTFNGFPAGARHSCIKVAASNNKVSGCYLYYGGNRMLDVANGVSNRGAFIELTQAEQCQPYVLPGGQTVLAVRTDAGGASLSALTAYLSQCTVINNQGLVGAASDTENYGVNVPLVNNAGPGVQWDNLYVIGCNFGLNRMSQNNNAVGSGITITNCTLGGATLDQATVSRCRFTYDSCVPNAAGNVQITNSIFVPVFLPVNTWGGFQVRGTFSVKNCTIDLRGNPTSGKNAYWFRSGAATWTFTNNIFITRNAIDTALHSGFLASDTLVFANNIYLLGPSDWVALNYNGSDRTFGQWQLAGFDSGSLNIDPLLDANERPGTPLVNIPGVNLGVMADYSGTIYDNRRSAGAYEYAINCATLLSTVGCFSCLPAGQLQLVELALLCEIAKKFFGVPLSSGLLAYWQLGAASGLRLDSVNGFDLAPNGAPLPENGPGIIDSAVTLVAANSQYLRNESLPASNPNGYTVNAWVKPVNLTNNYTVVLKSNAGGGTNREFSLLVLNSGNAQFGITKTNGILTTINGVTPLPANTFFMLTGTVQLDRTASLYVNGVLDTSVLLTLPPNSNSGRITIGGDEQNIPATLMDGLIDEVGLWSRPLSAAEVTRLYNAGGAVPFNQLQF